jgi:hypothetical protein
MQHKKEEDRTRVSSGEGFFPAKIGKQSRVSGKALTEEEDLLEAQGENGDRQRWEPGFGLVWLWRRMRGTKESCGPKAE